MFSMFDYLDCISLDHEPILKSHCLESQRNLLWSMPCVPFWIISPCHSFYVNCDGAFIITRVPQYFGSMFRGFVNSMLRWCDIILRLLVFLLLYSSKLILVLAVLPASTMVVAVGGAMTTSTSPPTTTVNSPSITTLQTAGVFNFQRCIQSKKVAWRRRFSYDNRNYPLRIEVTDRASHRIVSHILAIILYETLLYEDVTFVEQKWDSPHKVLNRLSCTNHSRAGCVNGSVPVSFINMEVWMPPGFNVEAWVNRGDVIDSGALGPIAYLGIFTHKSTVLRILQEYGITLDHYRALQIPRFREQLFHVSYNKKLSSMEESVYNQCNASSSSSSSYNITNCFPLYIDRMELLEPLKKLLEEVFPTPTFNVILVPHSTNLTHLSSPVQTSGLNQSENSIPIQFFAHWYPSEVTVRNEFTRILLPDSYTSNSRIVDESNNNPGNFDMYQLTRVMWSEIKHHAVHAYNLINAMVFSHAEYEDFLGSVNLQITNDQLKERDYNLIACQWVRNNYPKVQLWTPDALQKEKLIIGGMFPTHGKWQVPGLDQAASQTVAKLNKELMNTSQYEFMLQVEDLSCDQESVLNSYLKYVRSCQTGQPLVGVIAALCSNALEPMVKLTNLQRRVVISPTADSAKYLRGSQPNYFFRTVPSMRYYSVLLMDVFKRYKWQRVAIFRKDDDFIDKRTLGDGLAEVEDVELPEERFNYETVYNYLSEAKKKHLRIFIVEYFANNTNILICAAAKLNMTHVNGYVWFFNWWLPSKWYRKAENNCSIEEMESVAGRHLILKPQTPNTDKGSELPPQLLQVTMPPPPLEMPQKKPPGRKLPGGDLTIHYQPYTRDAVKALVTAVISLLKDAPGAVSALTSREIADALSRKLREASIISLGHGTQLQQIVSFNEQNERDAGLWSLLQQKKGFYVPILSWQKNNSHGINGTAIKSKGNVYWLRSDSVSSEMFDGRVPTDGFELFPEPNNDACVLGVLPKLLRITCIQAAVLVYGSIVFILIVVAVLVIIYYRRKLRLAEDENKRPFEELCEELQHLDVPAENIVTNHQIGQGAFGRVYGGEMKPKGGKGWLSVAVKVTNRECSYERKREVLEEARLMSKLDHPHVLKLYAICLHPSEDNFIHLIMEYMRLGDLKTYLLSRRPLCLTNPDNGEVSPETLTNFAVDIANGLSYMHDNNLIHRDLACRNCLVNDESERFIVKIGDFGMTRELKVDQPDRYYKLAKTTELPIRWMAPEAINVGRYDIQSDIWSYGVVIFEIITFGQFPMLSFCDEEVADKVKRNQLSVLHCLPEKASKMAVYRLIKKCCEFESNQRPMSMKQVLEDLVTDPQYIRPCLTEEPPKNPPPVNNAFAPLGGNKHAATTVVSGKHSEKSSQVRNVSIDNGIISPRRSSTDQMLSSSTHFCNGSIVNETLDSQHIPSDHGKNPRGPVTPHSILPQNKKSAVSTGRNFSPIVSSNSTPGGSGPFPSNTPSSVMHPANKSYSTEYLNSLQAGLREASGASRPRTTKEYEENVISSEDSSGGYSPGSETGIRKSFSKRLFCPRKSDTVELLPVSFTPSSVNSKRRNKSEQPLLNKHSSAGDSLADKKTYVPLDKVPSWNYSESVGSTQNGKVSSDSRNVSDSASSLNTPLRLNVCLQLDTVLPSQNKALLRVEENIYEPCPSSSDTDNINILIV